MKAHIVVDAVTGLTHSVVATSANQADITVAEQLLRDSKEPVYADAGYTGLGKRLGGDSGTAQHHQENGRWSGEADHAMH